MKIRKIRAVVILVFTILAGLGANYLLNGRAALGELRVSAQVKEIEGYRKWTKVTSKPWIMPAEVSKSCILLRDTTASKSQHGDPSEDKFFTVFVNDIGRDAMLKQIKPQFPEGAVIVKEKLSDRDSKNPELLTVMIKLKKGASPETGDWEYMVTDGLGVSATGRGKLMNCHTCHVSQTNTDQVFRTYLDKKDEKKLK